MKQLYPPADMDPEPPAENAGTGKKPAPFGKRRPSHGAMFGAPGEAPPKGKVRQLYPSPFADESVKPASSLEPLEIESGFEPVETVYDTPMTIPEVETWEPAGFEPVEDRASDGGLFVSGEQELEERRRRARERAEQRRLDDTRTSPLELNPPFHQGLDDHEE